RCGSLAVEPGASKVAVEARATCLNGLSVRPSRGSAGSIHAQACGAARSGGRPSVRSLLADRAVALWPADPRWPCAEPVFRPVRARPAAFLVIAGRDLLAAWQSAPVGRDRAPGSSSSLAVPSLPAVDQAPIVAPRRAVPALEWPAPGSFATVWRRLAPAVCAARPSDPLAGDSV